MLKSLLKMLGWIVGLLLLALICWLIAMQQDWPLWAAILLFIAALFGLYLCGVGYRRFRVWRVTRRLRTSTDSNTSFRTPELDRQWEEGLLRLKRSRLNRLGSTLYSLPWFIVLGTGSSGKSTLLTRTRLASSLKPVSQREPIRPTNALCWWYFDRSVILDTAGRLSEPEDGQLLTQEWERLLHKLASTRRREPLNGVVLTLSIAELLNAQIEQLADLGRLARAQIDALQRVFNARIPVYLVLTHADRLAGFTEWGKALPSALRQHAFGYMTTTPEAGASRFLEEAFAELSRRLADLRIKQGVHALPEASALLFPTQVAKLQHTLSEYLIPAFNATPYTDTPLLFGLYLTAQVPDAAGDGHEGWFSQHLFDTLLPSRRDYYRTQDDWRHWRRFLKHSGSISWLAICALLIIWISYGYLAERATVKRLSAYNLKTLDFSGPFSNDITEILVYLRVVEVLKTHNHRPITRMLPFHRYLVHAQQYYQSTYTQVFRQEVLKADIDPMISQRLPTITSLRDDALVAAYAQHLVRRINLLDAVLEGRNPDSLPLPGSELIIITDDYNATSAALPENAQALSEFGPLYLAYVQWQPNRDILLAERSTLYSALGLLGLPERPLSWLLSWADMQGTLEPVTASQFWNIIDTPDMPRVNGAFVADGYQAIIGFFNELAQATRNDVVWRQQKQIFLQRYQEAQTNAWFQFLTAFPSFRQHLPDETSWRSTLSTLTSENDPYLQLLHQISLAFDAYPNNPPWINLAQRLDFLQKIARDRASSSALKAGSMNQLATAGIKLLHGLGAESLLAKKALPANNDLALANMLVNYNKTFQQASSDMLKGSGHTFKIAADTYAFSRDPSIKQAILVDLFNILTAMRNSIDSDGPREQAVWALAQGPLSFAFDYANRVAACELQHSWDDQVLAALQGVTDPEESNKLLYGDNGQIPTFMAGPIKSFVDRDAQRYRPREVLGHQLPLNAIFYAFVSRAQLEKVSIGEEKKAQTQTQQAMKRESDDIDLRIIDLEKKAAQLRATTAAVTLSVEPTSVNPGSTVLPQQTTLTLQCDSGATLLNNFNFPASAVFNWSLANCGDVNLQIGFPGLSVNKRWTGPRAFIEVLKLFSSGQYLFRPADFPSAQAALEQLNIKSMTITYRPQGQETLLANFSQLDTLQTQLNSLRTRSETLRNSLASSAEKQASTPTANTVGDIPRQIARCWTTEAAITTQPNTVVTPPIDVSAPVATQLPRVTSSSTVTVPPASAVTPTTKKPQRAASEPQFISPSGQYTVQVGVFSQPKAVEEKLITMGFSPVRKSIGEARYSVQILGFEDQRAAQAAVQRIGEALHLAPLILRASSTTSP